MHHRLQLTLLIGATSLTLAADAPAPTKPGHLRIGLVNLKCLTTDSADTQANTTNLAANVQRHVYFIERLAAQGVDFIGFPELSLNGYHFSTAMTWLRTDGPELKVLRDKAAEKKVYVAAGLAERDADGRRWNTHVIIGPGGDIIGQHRKIYLTKEKDLVEAGNEHRIFDVKGLKVGIAICADGSDRKNLDALVANGAQLIYAPHANTTGGTIAGWYKFRAAWAGENGWIAQAKVFAALHNHAAHYAAEFEPPSKDDANTGWASGAWVIGPDGATLAQMPTSTARGDSKEFVLVYDVPIRN